MSEMANWLKVIIDKSVENNEIDVKNVSECESISVYLYIFNVIII
jgi:hypothetical protein